MLEGSVVDVQGGSLNESTVKIREILTGATRTLHAGAAGLYHARGLTPGTYELEVSRDSFQTAIRRDVGVAAGQVVRADFVLQVGLETQVVEVRGQPPLVGTNASDWGGSIHRGQLEDLPLAGRDIFDLVNQEAGANVAINSAAELSTGIGLQISVNGNRPNQNSFRLDGIYINDATNSAPASSAGRLLGVEGLRELRLVTSPFSAEHGRAGGAMMTAVTRNGTNDLHGSGYWLFRNERLDARNFFDAPDQPQPPLRRNQFGGSIGGPLKHDRIFFFLNYEGIRENISQTLRTTSITATAREGIVPGPDGPQTILVADSVKPYLELFPLPNGRDFGDGTGEFSATGTTDNHEDFFSGRVDLLWNDSLRTSARYTLNNADSSGPDPFLVWTLVGDSRFQFIHTDTQWTPSSNFVHNFRAGFSRVRNDQSAALQDGIPSEDLAFIGGRSLGTLQVTGLSIFGITQVRIRPRIHITNDYQFNYEAAYIQGSQTFRFGTGIDRIQFNQRADISFNGRYQFTSLENFLRGSSRLADLMAVGSDTIRGWRQTQFYAFVQDEVRLAPGLSLSLGLRYETYTSPSEVNGKVANVRDPLNDRATTVGEPFFENPSATNFAPRIALAWDVDGSGRTVLRAGTGIFYDLLGAREAVIAGTRLTPFFNRVFLFRPDFPDLGRAAADAPKSKSLDTFQFRPEQPYVLQAQLELQRQLDAKTVLSVGYRGSRGVHLVGQLGDANLGTPQVQEDGRLFFAADAPLLNPNFTRIGLRGTFFDSNYHSLQAAVRRRLSRGVRAGAAYTWGKLIDNSSSAIFTDFAQSDATPNPFQLGSQRGPGDFDIRHAFTANFSWSLPEHSAGAADWLANGWALHGLVQAQTGFAFSPFVGFDRARLQSNFGDLGQRPDLARVGGDTILGDPERYFDPMAFSLPRAGFYGNLGRNALPGPGLFNMNFAVHKRLFQNETQSLRLRVEMFNLTNHPNFSLPSALSLFNSSGSRVASAGRISNTATPAREIQMALRWAF